MILKKVSDLNHYEILNLAIAAAADEIQQAYLNATSIYSEDSIASYRALNPKEREWMLERIQEAYETLINTARRSEYDSKELNLTERDKKESKDKVNLKEKTVGRLPPIPARAPGRPTATPQFHARKITGANLRDIRKARGASLEEISEITKIRKSFLEAIEKQDISHFPAPVFIKGYLRAYAEALSLDPVEIIEKYVIEE